MIRWLRFVWREFTGSGAQALVILLCVSLSTGAFVCVAGFRDHLRRTVFADARALHAGDIIIRSRAPLSPELDRAVADLTASGRAESTSIFRFYSVVRADKAASAALAAVKAVGKGYPFYGSVGLASGRSFSEVLTPGHVIVEAALLERIGARVGDMLHLGRARLKIADVVIREPDRPVNFLAFGPRVFASADDLDAMDLLKPGSRAHYERRLRLPRDVSGASPESAAAVAAELQESALAGEERINTYRNAGSRVERFFGHFLFYLSLTSLFSLLLSGIGIFGAMNALVRRKVSVIAVFRVMGAGNGFLLGRYMGLTACYGLAGALGGLMAGWALMAFLPALFGSLLPAFGPAATAGSAAASTMGSAPGLISALPAPSAAVCAQGMLAGLLAALVFGFAPICRILDIRPVMVLRHLPARARKGPLLMSVLAGLPAAALLMRLQMESGEGLGVWLGGIAALITACALVSGLLLAVLKRIPFSRLSLRLAVRGIFRPGGGAFALVLSFSAAAALLLSVRLIELNLDFGFMRTFPPDAPNLFFLDIQADQQDGAAAIIGGDPRFYPVIRSRLAAVRGEKIDPGAERRRRGDNLARPFNLTYRNDLLADEKIIQPAPLKSSSESPGTPAADSGPGRTGVPLALFGNMPPDGDILPVSVLDTAAKMKDMRIGDRLDFLVQGLPLTAEITSIRTREEVGIRPFFYFVFPPESWIAEAPQTIFCAVKTPGDRISSLRAAIMSRYPNISVINAAETLRSFSGIMTRLSSVIRFFAGISLAAGLLMLFGSLAATRYDRLTESACFRIVGAPVSLLHRIFLLEHLMLALAAAVTGMAVALGVSWLVCVRLLDMSWRPFPAECAMAVGGLGLTVALTGTLFSVPLLRRPPLQFIREQGGE